MDDTPEIPNQYEAIPSPMEVLETDLREVGYELPHLSPEEGKRAVEQTSPEINELLNEGNPWAEVKEREIAHERMAARAYNDAQMARLQIDLERQFFLLSQPDQDRALIVRTLHSIETRIQERAKALDITPRAKE